MQSWALGVLGDRASRQMEYDMKAGVIQGWYRLSPLH